MIRNFFVAALWAALVFPLPASAEYLSIAYTNKTPFELILLSSRLADSGGERVTGSSIDLAPGETFRLGVAGAVAPLAIYLHFVEGRLEFEELSALNVSESMVVDVVLDEKGARLEQSGGSEVRSAPGTVRWFLTDANRANAVSWESLIASRSLEDVRAKVTSAEAGDKPAPPRGSVSGGGWPHLGQ